MAGTADEQTRRRTIDALRDLQYALEPPEETMQRLLVSLDLKIFDMLSESEIPLSLDELAQRSGAGRILLGKVGLRCRIVGTGSDTFAGRFLRHQSSLGIIKETDKDEFTASTQRGIFPFQRSRPACTSGNEPIRGATKQRLTRPRETSYFNRFMYAQRSGMKNCFSFLPIDQECKDWPADQPVFVDVGGGTGQQCTTIKEKCPNLPGRVILQDLPAVIAEAKVPDDIETMAYDFFTPQPIKGAKYYYLRAIMHDHADDKCLEILKRVADAMSPKSILLLDEIVVPNKNVEWYVTQTDLAMMVQFSSTERTEDQWRELLGKAGLEVQKITTYTYTFRLSVIAAMKKE
ncbi:O-methyltransferase-domain-containing protein [Massariosphaeria phaeospora]|uniref:O-methyltransferase-domain-containing protein n=1 Tax=Massariosphaeria phaeospora TaxID=100035 RepID=A0A7C8IML4_9PLEO|nr:O-methyltransferase-domain-containing protein [Massariosphaeria phaeospora]